MLLNHLKVYAKRSVQAFWKAEVPTFKRGGITLEHAIITHD